MKQLAAGSKYACGLYAWNLGRANQLFHIGAYSLAMVVDAELACKLMLALSMMLWALGSGRLCRHVGADPWNVWVVAPLAYGFGFFFGMAPFTLGVGLLLWCLPDLDDFAGSPSKRQAVTIMFEIVMLFFAHESAMLIYAGAAVVLGLGGSWRSRDALARLSVPAAAAAVMVVDYMVGLTTISQTEAARTLMYGHLLPRITEVFTVLIGMNEHNTVRVAGGLWILALIVRVVPLRSTPKTQIGRPFDLRRTIGEWRFEILSASCFIVYLVFPSQMHGATYLEERFLVPAAAIAGSIVGGRRSTGWWRRSLGVAFETGILLAIAPVLLTNEDELGHVRELAASVEPDSSIVELQLDRIGDWVFSFLSSDTYVAALRGGRSANTWVDSNIAPVMVKKGCEWQRARNRLISDPMQFAPQVDFRFYRYALIHTENDLLGQQVMARLLQPEGRFVAASGPFVLVESMLPLYPPNSRLYDSIPARGSTVQERFERIAPFVDDPGWLNSEVTADEIEGPLECIDPQSIPAACWNWRTAARHRPWSSMARFGTSEDTRLNADPAAEAVGHCEDRLASCAEDTCG